LQPILRGQVIERAALSTIPSLKPPCFPIYKETR
jgi:hypothetical protein